MDTPSGFDIYMNWAKARIDEMDATPTSLEDKAAGMKAGRARRPTRFGPHGEPGVRRGGSSCSRRCQPNSP